MVESNGHAAHVNGSAMAEEEPVVVSKKRCLWFEEELEEDLRWVFGVSKCVPPFPSFFLFFSREVLCSLLRLRDRLSYIGGNITRTALIFT